MRRIILLAAIALACGTAYARDLTNFQVAQATSAPQAAPAPQAAVPEAAAPPTAKPAKKRQTKRRETDEEKARRIAAKYGISW